jgi:hypothetical protein
MADIWRMTRRRQGRISAACLLLAGGISVSVLLGGGTAQAAACVGAPVTAPTACTLTGTLTVTAGSLTLTSPTALGWSETENGLDQQLVDPTTAHQSFTVDDATGSGAGWHITITATQFGNGVTVLPNTGTFVLTGSTSSEAATTAPTSACSASSTCTVSTTTTTYPVAITTAAAGPPTVTIYSASAGTGLGTLTLGIGANPVGWWVNAPAFIRAISYTSTINLAIVTAP